MTYRKKLIEVAMPLEVILFAGGGSHNGIFVVLSCRSRSAKLSSGSALCPLGASSPTN